MSEIKCVIFDFGNVIAKCDHLVTCRKLSAICGKSPQEIYDLIWTSGLEKRFDEGLAPEEFYREALGYLGLEENELAMNRFADIWGDIFESNSAIEPIIENIKLPKLMLSNTNAWHYKYMKMIKGVQMIPKHILSFEFRIPEAGQKNLGKSGRSSGLPVGGDRLC